MRDVIRTHMLMGADHLIRLFYRTTRAHQTIILLKLTVTSNKGMRAGLSDFVKNTHNI